MGYSYTKDELWTVSDKRGINFECMDKWDIHQTMHTVGARWIVFVERLKRVFEVWK